MIEMGQAMYLGSDGKVHVPNLRDGYVDLVDWVKNNGREVSPRGYKTWEVEDATFVVDNPLDVMPVGIGRNLKPDIGAAEAILLVAGLSDPTFMVSVSRQFARFLDGGVLHGAYGPRVRPQLINAVRRLSADRDTRQAVIQIWDPLYDGLETRDLPCTLGFNFRIRDGKLNMSGTMRSNDVWLGTAYDVFMFTQLQATVARALDVPIGTYTHHAYSLHLYERNLEQVEQLHYTDDLTAAALDVENHPRGFGGGTSVNDPLSPVEWIADAMERAVRIYDQSLDVGHMTQSELWYANLLKDYDRLQRMENFSS